MPSFEFVIPESFLFIPANLSFISFCFFISFILSKILKSAIVFFLLLISMLSIGYYDLFIKFAIKNYYELTQMNSKIYTYPVKNKDYKLESLSMVGVYVYPLKYSTTLSSLEKDEIRKVHEEYIDKFIDISTYAYRFNKYIYNTERVYLNSYSYNENLITNRNEEANFTISKIDKESFFPKIFAQYEYRFLDKKTNTILATAFKISFLTNYNKFRNKYLYWTQEKEEDFNLPPVQNFDYIYKDLFIDIK
jgi:hypothetical protein